MTGKHMSKLTSTINKISAEIISLSAKAVFYAAVAVVIIVVARAAYSFGHGIFYAPAMEAEPGTTMYITLTGDESVYEVGKILEEEGLIRDSAAFVVQAILYDYDVRPGTFELSTTKSSKQLISILRDDDSGSS